MRNDEEPSGRSKAWIWILVIVLIGLLMVPFMAMGVAVKKSGFNNFMASHGFGGSSTIRHMADTNESVPPEPVEMTGLRAMLEKAASKVIKLPKLNSKMKEVQIQAPKKSMRVATDEIHQLLSSRNLQFVEAVESDRLRIIVIMPSKDWPELAGSLHTAALKDGFIYRGPSQTETAGNQADTMVAQIEILKNLQD
jgi:flagellar basal body-associated protein FliL